MDGLENSETIPSSCPNFPAPVNITIGDRDGTVMMVFDKNITWLQMDAVTAIKVGEMLKERGIEILRSQEK